MKNLLLTGMLLFAFGARAEKFPIFDDQRIPRPDDLRQVSASEFKVDIKRIKARRNGHLYGDKAALIRLGKYFTNDPDGKRAWNNLADNAEDIIKDWDLNRRGFGANRFIYALYMDLENLSVVYMYTGHKELGMFLKAHLMQAAELPMEFWLHSELRGYNRKKPLGQLETATLGRAYAASLSMVEDLLSAEEMKTASKALYDKSYIPVLNWLDNPRTSNFTAVIGTGAYVCARFFNDPAGMNKALGALDFYLSGTIEDDGSYGEGVGYFSYPISTMLSAVLTMDAAAKEIVFSKSGLRYSSRWLAYPYLYARSSNGKMEPVITHFGDNSFNRTPSAGTNTIIASVYDDGMAMWLMDKFNVNWKSHWRLQLLVYAANKELPKPISPSEIGLPLVKTFDSGDCFIRSSWDDNGIVMALLAGGSGRGTKIKYAHRRPEINSICMGAYGEYLVVSSGSASYRSPLHYTWDRMTRAANTVTIDGKNQLFPGSGKMKGWGLNVDVSDIWEKGNPTSEIIECRAGEMADVLINEAAKAYHAKMKHVRRSVVFVRDPGYFVIVDHMESLAGKHKYNWYMHFNNRDEKAVLKEQSNGNWLLTRPVASMIINVAACSDAKLTTGINQGYMHGGGRDYSPGGVHEGKPGSSIELTAFNTDKLASLTFVSVLYPFKNSTKAPMVSSSGSIIKVGSDVLTLNNGNLTLSKGDKTEIFKLW